MNNNNAAPTWPFMSRPFTPLALSEGIDRVARSAHDEDDDKEEAPPAGDVMRACVHGLTAHKA